MNTSILNNYYILEDTIHIIRRWFEEHSFHEVISWNLHEALPTEPNLYPFSTEWESIHGKKHFYLPLSPELSIKKMLARGIGNCYAIGTSYRNLEGAGSLHTPAFLMLEWYRENATYQDIVKDLQKLIGEVFEGSEEITYQGMSISLNKPWRTISLIDAFEEYLDGDLPSLIDDSAMCDFAQSKGYVVNNADWGQLYDQLLVNEIEPHLPSEPCILVDYPMRISPLCAVQKDNPHFAERFEFYLCGMELANGNNENTDWKTVQNVMETEHAKRIVENKPVAPIDYEFIEALRIMSSKLYAGIGLGIERLAMIKANLESIQEIV